MPDQGAKRRCSGVCNFCATASSVASASILSVASRGFLSPTLSSMRVKTGTLAGCHTRANVRACPDPYTRSIRVILMHRACSESGSSA